MKAIFIFIVIVASSLPIVPCSAATLTSNGTGGGLWDDANAWDGINTPADMASGDTLIIQVGDTIIIDNNQSFSGVLQIYGALLLDNGKLEMPDTTSVVQFAPGSYIEALNTGQNEYISIGSPSNRISSSDINSMTIPNQLTYGSISSGGCAVTGDCDENPLPVEIIYFRAKELRNSVKLEWATSLEENFDYFTVERSPDGRDFKDYAYLSSQKILSTITRSYEYIDEMPFPGLSYYRLKATDLDGYEEYHGVVSVNLQDINPDILLYPNPTDKGTLTASFNGESESNYSLINITGEIVQEGIIVPGLNYITVPPSLHSSIYFLQVVGNHAAIIKKFAVY